MSINPLDVPFNAGYNEQRREYLYGIIAKHVPELAGHPDLIYGDLELIYMRYKNAGRIPEAEGGVVNSLPDPFIKTWTGTAWPARDNSLLPRMWVSTNDANAPQPPMINGDIWIPHPESTVYP